MNYKSEDYQYYGSRDINNFNINNKFVYIKKEEPFKKSQKILVNPHFKQGMISKVYINPTFHQPQNRAAVQPKIHVNPNLINTFTIQQPKDLKPTNLKLSVEIPSPIVKNLKNESRKIISRTKIINLKSSPGVKRKIISRTKILNEPVNKSNKCLEISKVPSTKTVIPINSNNSPIKKRKLISRTKILNVPVNDGNISRKKIISRMKIINIPNKKVQNKTLLHQSQKLKMTCLRSKYKIKNCVKLNNSSKENKFSSSSANLEITKNRFNRKRYVYINKYNSLSLIAKNVVLKHTKLKNNYIYINGIMYKNTPSSLHKSGSNLSLNALRLAKSRQMIPKKILRSTANKFGENSKYKLIRRSLKKNNLSCAIFRKYGRCRRKENGSCNKTHNPDQIILCPSFLQGTCIKTNCLLSHKVSAEKMPTCKYYLEGLCSKTDCQYLHVKISPKAEICRDFLNGYCNKGLTCDKRHQFLCPDFEKNKKCPKKRCPYPHNRPKTPIKKKIKKAHCDKNRKNKTVNIKIELQKETKRYFCDSNEDNLENDNDSLKPRRPKLGELPAFIPLQKES